MTPENPLYKINILDKEISNLIQLYKSTLEQNEKLKKKQSRIEQEVTELKKENELLQKEKETMAIAKIVNESEVSAGQKEELKAILDNVIKLLDENINLLK